MTSVGKQLRSAREEQQRSLAEIAEDLCITQRYLRAIEEDDLASLPGVFFYKSFVKQYASILDVDLKQLQAGIEALCPSPVEAARADTTWLSITANGKEIFSGVLQPSQSKTLTGVEGAQIRVGNAGGIEVKWKGKPIGPFGPSGQVRTVQLTEDNFKIIPPEPATTD